MLKVKQNLLLQKLSIDMNKLLFLIFNHKFYMSRKITNIEPKEIIFIG